MCNRDFQLTLFMFLQYLLKFEISKKNCTRKIMQDLTKFRICLPQNNTGKKLKALLLLEETEQDI